MVTTRLVQWIFVMSVLKCFGSELLEGLEPPLKMEWCGLVVGGSCRNKTGNILVGNILFY